jgi:hypothetical protein
VPDPSGLGAVASASDAAAEGVVAVIDCRGGAGELGGGVVGRRGGAGELAGGVVVVCPDCPIGQLGADAAAGGVVLDVLWWREGLEGGVSAAGGLVDRAQASVGAPGVAALAVDLRRAGGDQAVLEGAAVAVGLPPAQDLAREVPGPLVAVAVALEVDAPAGQWLLDAGQAALVVA